MFGALNLNQLLEKADKITFAAQKVRESLHSSQIGEYNSTVRELCKLMGYCSVEQEIEEEITRIRECMARFVKTEKL